MKIETTIPAELLDLKARLDQWRANRKYLREPLPDDLRQEVIGASRKYPGLLWKALGPAEGTCKASGQHRFYVREAACFYVGRTLRRCKDRLGCRRLKASNFSRLTHNNSP